MSKFKKLILRLFAFMFSIAMLGVTVLVGNRVAFSETDYVFEMLTGASVRLAAPYGIKFSAKVGKDLYLTQKNYRVIIVPQSYIDKYVTSAENIDYYAEFSANAPHFADISAQVIYDSNEDCYYAEGALVDILYKNLNRNFFGIVYYTDGNGVRRYADINDNKRNITTVVNRAFSANEEAVDPVEYSDAQEWFLNRTVRKAGLSDCGMTDENSAEEYLSDGYYFDLVPYSSPNKMQLLLMDKYEDTVIDDAVFTEIDDKYLSVTESGVITEKSFSKETCVTIECKVNGYKFHYQYVIGNTALYDFELQDDYYSIKLKEGADIGSSVYIPSAYNGKPVKDIYKKAFYDNAAIEKVYFGDTVVSIANQAFSKCSNLSEINFGINSNLNYIGMQVFKSTSLVTLILPKNLETIKNAAFNSISTLKKLYLPVSLKHIGSDVFSGCTALEVAVFANKNGWHLEDVDHNFKRDIKYSTIYKYDNVKEWLTINSTDDNYDWGGADLYWENNG